MDIFSLSAEYYDHYILQKFHRRLIEQLVFHLGNDAYWFWKFWGFFEELGVFFTFFLHEVTRSWLNNTYFLSIF